MRAHSVAGQVVLNAYWIPLNFQNAALLTIAVPALIRRFAGINYVSELALLATLVAAISLVVPPVAGEISDRLHRAGQPRRGAILAGAAVNVAALLWMAVSPTPTTFAIAVVVATLGQNVSAAAYSALIPEVVSREHWGAASGYQGVGTLVGNIAGLAVAGIAGNAVVTLVVAAAVVAVGALSVLALHEGRYIESGHVQVRNSSNFAIAFASRFWTNFGLALLSTYIFYFFSDVLKVQNASAGTSLAAGMTMAGAIVSSICLGYLSDRVERKFVVAGAGIPMALAAIGFGLFPQLRWILLFAILFGLGYGALVSTGWALAIDSVPQIGNVARYLGIWGIAFNLPAVFAPGVGAWFLARDFSPMDDYRALFVASGACFVLGSLIVLFISRAAGRSVLPWHGGGFQAFAMACIHPYYLTVNRVRSWGRLPRRRGATMIISNHQHDLDTTCTIMRLSVQGPLHRPIFAVGSRRVFEPGFMSWRIPWLQPLLRNWSGETMFRMLGVLPIENEPRRRSLATLAWTIYRRHGDVHFRDVFRDGSVAVAEAANVADSRLTTIFTEADFMALRDAYVSLAALREPYQTEIVDETRRNVDLDLKLIEDVMHGGGTLYLTPEGRYSKNGKLSRFRLALDRLAPLAENIYILAVTYDPFAGRRLSMLFRVVPAADRADLRSSMAAARPIVVSQLLGEFFTERDGEFSESTAVDAVGRRLSSLPAAAWIDPEFAADPGRSVKRALRFLADLGLLKDTYLGFAQTEQRKDPRFPDVADIIAFQRNMFEETLAGIEALERNAAAK